MWVFSWFCLFSSFSSTAFVLSSLTNFDFYNRINSTMLWHRESKITLFSRIWSLPGSHPINLITPSWWNVLKFSAPHLTGPTLYFYLLPLQLWIWVKLIIYLLLICCRFLEIQETVEVLSRLKLCLNSGGHLVIMHYLITTYFGPWPWNIEECLQGM